MQLVAVVNPEIMDLSLKRSMLVEKLESASNADNADQRDSEQKAATKKSLSFSVDRLLKSVTSTNNTDSEKSHSSNGSEKGDFFFWSKYRVTRVILISFLQRENH